jgi:uncharacterized protein involved in exopolysaccharide biosynthesis
MAIETQPPPLLAYAAMIWKRKIVVILIASAMAAPAFVVSVLRPPTYQSVGQILITQQQFDDSYNVRPTALSDTQMSNEVSILTGADVSEAASRNGAQIPVRATGAAATNVVTLTSQGASPEQSTTALNAQIQAYSDHRTATLRKTLGGATNQLESRIADLKQQINAAAPGDRATLQQQDAAVEDQLGRVRIQQGLISDGIEIVQRPAALPDPISPTPARDTALGLVLGLVLGASVAVLLETVRNRRSALSENGVTGAPPNHRRPANGLVNGYDSAPSYPHSSATPEYPSSAEFGPGGVERTHRLAARPVGEAPYLGQQPPRFPQPPGGPAGNDG